MAEQKKLKARWFDYYEIFVPGKCGDVSAEQEERANQFCITVLDPARDFVGAPITVNSGKRSALHNATVGGVPSSEHLWNGDDAAVDLDTKSNEKNRTLFKFLVETPSMRAGVGQVIAYLNTSNVVEFVHVSKITNGWKAAKESRRFLVATYEAVRSKRKYAPYTSKIERPK